MSREVEKNGVLYSEEMITLTLLSLACILVMAGKLVGNFTLVFDVRVAPAIRGRKLPSPEKPCKKVNTLR